MLPLPRRVNRVFELCIGDETTPRGCALRFLCCYLPMSLITDHVGTENHGNERSAPERKEPTHLFTEKYVVEKSQIARSLSRRGHVLRKRGLQMMFGSPAAPEQAPSLPDSSEQRFSVARVFNG